MSALRIDDQETVRLAQELADLEGKSLTAAVTDALREKLNRERKPQINEARMQYWLEFGKRVRETADPEWLAADPFDELYDENGLPR